jgi:SAM-dependent methyltransferase
VKNLKVIKDKTSGVIYIDDYFVGNDTYLKGEYRKEESTASAASYEDSMDCKRRSIDFSKYYKNKIICDFGCGRGSFLLNTIDQTIKSYGVELQEDYSVALNSQKIECKNNIKDIKDDYLDSCFLFHVLEHLEDPIKNLKSIKSKLKNGANIIIEVPHANDFLIKNLKIKEFIDFTLWSQHLILHTRESLEKFLSAAGYKNIKIYGVQRFSIANHLQWATNKIPGGHRGELAYLEEPELVKAYQETLNRIDATDTLIAIASK